LEELKNETSLPQGIDFSELETAITLFEEAAAEIDVQSNCVASNSSCADDIVLEELNTRLRLTERRFLLNAVSNSSDDGLPYRPWYKHAIQAPGIYYGYGSQTFPGIMQGILDNNATLIQDQIGRVAFVVSDAASALTELSVTAKPSMCYGDSTGKLFLTAKGGFTPLSYLATGPKWVTFNEFDNVTIGTYTVYVRDSEGIMASAKVTLEQPTEFKVEVVLDKSKAKAVITGGAGEYEIKWSTDEKNTTEIVVPKTGTYSVVVTDGNGCTASTTFEYTSQKGLSAGGVVGIVFAVLIAIAVVVAILYFLRRRNKTANYLHL